MHLNLLCSCVKASDPSRTVVSPVAPRRCSEAGSAKGETQHHHHRGRQTEDALASDGWLLADQCSTVIGSVSDHAIYLLRHTCSVSVSHCQPCFTLLTLLHSSPSSTETAVITVSVLYASGELSVSHRSLLIATVFQSETTSYHRVLNRCQALLSTSFPIAGDTSSITTEDTEPILR